jgi:uncharacterized membrane protein YhhN
MDPIAHDSQSEYNSRNRRHKVKPVRIALVLLFLVFSVIEIYAAFTNQTALKFVSTPALMPLLAIFYLVSARKKNWLIVAALALSLFGDVLNQWQTNEDIFMIETGAFLVALVCYIIALNQPVSHLRRVPPTVYLLSVLYVAYGIVVYLMLRSYLGEMELPAIVYLAIVLLMSFSALARTGQFRGYSFWLPLIGSLFFIASDTFLAVNAFRYNGHLAFGDFLTTLFYIPAQVLIVLGFISSEKRPVQQRVPA